MGGRGRNGIGRISSVLTEVKMGEIFGVYQLDPEELGEILVPMDFSLTSYYCIILNKFTGWALY